MLLLSLEYTVDSFGWVILTSPNYKSLICRDTVWLGFTRCRKGICFLGLAFSFNNMVLRFIRDIVWNWFIRLHRWMTCRRVNESTVIYLPNLFSMGIWVVSRFLLLRTVQLWTFSSKSLGAHAKVSLDFMPRGDMPGPSFIRWGWLRVLSSLPPARSYIGCILVTRWRVRGSTSSPALGAVKLVNFCS